MIAKIERMDGSCPSLCYICQRVVTKFTTVWFATSAKSSYRNAHLRICPSCADVLASFDAKQPKGETSEV